MKRALASLVFIASLSANVLAQDPLHQFSKAYHWCSFEYHFSLPFPPNRPPVQSYQIQPKRVHKPWPTDFKLERSWVETNVEADGSISALKMTWDQGGFAWPVMTRAELDNIALGAVFEEKSKKAIPEAVRNFDPEKLIISFSAFHLKKLKHHTVLTLRYPYDHVTPKLGGLATNQWGGRRSSDISLQWPQLRALQRESDWLDFDVEALTYRSGNLLRDHIRGGRVYVALMPKLIDAFYEAERQAKALKTTTAKECRFMGSNVDFEISP